MEETIGHIQELQTILGLSQHETADLFQVPHQTLSAWMISGVPLASRASVEEVYDLALFLDREMMRSRLPKIVHTPDAWLGNRSILQVIASDGVGPLRAYLTRVFGYRI